MKPKNPFVPFSRYCVRVPSFSKGFLERLWASTALDEELKTIFQDRFLREAIYLASPELYDQLCLWETDTVTNIKKKNRIRTSLLKYLTRMGSRCTPFGLFSGIGTGTFTMETAVVLEEADYHDLVARYDMHFLFALAKEFSAREHIKTQLLYYPNTTLYRWGDRYRYVEYSYQDKKREHSIESVLHSEYLESILERATHGALIKDLVAYLKQQGFEDGECQEFTEALITNQILVGELEPTITGTDFLLLLQQKLAKLQNCETEMGIIEQLLAYQVQLSQIRTDKIPIYFLVKNYVSSLKLDVEPKYLLQTDLYPKFRNNQMHQRLQRKLQLGIWLLNKISKHESDAYLEQFKKAFNKRFEHRKMPLLEVLDIESGIGYGNSQVAATPFLDDIKLPAQENSTSTPLSSFQKVLHRKLHTCLLRGEKVIELGMEDIEDLEENWDLAADTLSVMAEITRENGREQVFMDFAGAHAARLLGRFASSTNTLGDLVNEIATKEKELRPETILAELVHIPEARTGNILRRPQLRSYEIPCLGNSGLPREQQIRLQDILVSVSFGEIVLTHGVTGKKILPRLSNAHNYRNNPLPVYQFLCDLQHQNNRSYGFNWGSFMEESHFLPRVVFKDIILAKARWNIVGKKIDAFKLIFEGKNEETQLTEKITGWAEQLGMPTRVQLVEGDNTLTIDLTAPWSAQMLYEKCKRKKVFVLQEVLQHGEGLISRNDETFHNEFVFSFYRTNKASLN